jgi:hypothetical protein
LSFLSNILSYLKALELPSQRFEFVQEHLSWFVFTYNRDNLLFSFAGCSPLWTTRHRKNIIGTCSCSPHWLYLHQSIWLWVGSKVYWWGFPHGSWTLCYG